MLQVEEWQVKFVMVSGVLSWPINDLHSECVLLHLIHAGKVTVTVLIYTAWQVIYNIDDGCSGS